MVWGPKSTGKSLGLQAMAELWQKQGRVVIDVDLKDLVGGYDRFIHYFWHRVLHALWGLNLTPDELRTCYVCSPHCRNKHQTTTATATTTAPNFLSRWLSDYNLAHDTSFENLNTYLQFIFTNTTEDRALGVDFQGLIEFLELLVVQRPQTGPVVILREIQHLNHIGGDALLSNILRTLESKKQGRSLVGVIIETPDFSWVDATTLLRSRESFRPYLVSHMERETTRQELVDVLQAFSPVEFDEVWDATKGHAGSLNMVFEDVRGGIPLPQAIETARTFTFEMLHAGLQKAPAALRCKEELERLRQQGWELGEEGPLANPALRFLIEHYILFVFQRTTVVPQHEMMRWAIDTFLTSFPLATPAVARQ
jgi:hypothetical protein